MTQMKKKLSRAIGLTLTFSMVASLGITTAFAAPGDTTLEDAILYTIDGNTLEYNVTYEATIPGTVTVTSAEDFGIDSLAELKEVMGTADKPAVQHGTDVGERTLGKAVTADLTLTGKYVTGIEVTSVEDRPTVGISWKSDNIGTDYQGFAEAFERNGAYAVYLPQITTDEDAQEVLSDVDGIFVTGGSDWNAWLYGEEQSPHGAGGPNDARDTSDIKLMQQSVEMDVPMLAVCRGEQGFNVAMGGSLIQDVPYYLGQQVLSGEISPERVTKIFSGASDADLATIAEANNMTVEALKTQYPIFATYVKDTGYTMREFYEGGSTSLGKTYTAANAETGTAESWVEGSGCKEGHLRVAVDDLVHSGGKSYHGEVLIDENSEWLYDILQPVMDDDNTLDIVATAHHQSVNPEKLGNGLTVVARSSDGIVEAIEHQDSLFSLAIQWHPERDALGDSSTAVKNAVDVDQDQCNALLGALVDYAGIYQDQFTEDVVLYPTDEANTVEYNVTHSAALADEVAVYDGTGSGIDTLTELNEVMGIADAPAVELGTDVGVRTLGKAVTADLKIVDDEVVAILIDRVEDRPTVGISWKRDSIGTDYQGFAEAFERNGAYAVYLPQITSASDARTVLSAVDGIFVTGGEDWNPALYGEEAYTHGSSGWNDARDTSDINLMQQAIAMDVPMLAVCRGEQGFNVAMGGGLIQDIPTYLGEKVKNGEIAESRATVIEDQGIGEWYQDASGDWNVKYTPCEPTHYRVWIDGLVHSGGTGYHVLDAGTNNDNVAISQDSKWLYDILGTDELELVATAHHQAADPDNLGDGLTVVARSSDGIIEAIEHQDSLFALALQWHPERDALGDSRNDSDGNPIDVDQDQCNALLGALVDYAAVYSENPYVEPSHHSSGGGSSSSSSSYAVSAASTDNGSVSVSPKNAAKGNTVTITVKPDSGYELDKITVTDKNGDTVKVTEKNGKYTFTMPASKVTVDASFVKTQAETPSDTGFADVADSAYYADAVKWAVDKGVTSGTSANRFSPDATCTRAQTVTFLWRAAGSPAPTSTENPFTDVNSGDYYYDAVLWAVEKGITSGTSDTTFSPAATVTRGQTVTFLYRTAGSPAVTGSASFDDVSADAYYASPVQWAVSEGVTSGTGNNAFSPAADCTRGQIVTFLWKANA